MTFIRKFYRLKVLTTVFTIKFSICIFKLYLISFQLFLFFLPLNLPNIKANINVYLIRIRSKDQIPKCLTVFDE